MPALFVPAVGLGVTCVDPYVAAIGTTTYFGPEVDGVLPTVVAGEYYVQGEDDWQASCTTELVDTVDVTADWGDNLTGAPLKAGTPIRVEMGLLATNPTGYEFTGFSVVKLTDQLDREATYGTLGVAEPSYGEVRAWDADAHLKIAKTDNTLTVIDAAATAEINSTGRVVYGWNWQLPEAGEYLITFTAPNVTFVGSDVGSVVDGDTVTLLVNVAATAGGGGGGGGGQGGGGGGGQGGGGGGRR
ncbi:MAG: hypothetical protein ABR500_11510 [Dermatophilaceae bacterium]